MKRLSAAGSQQYKTKSQSAISKIQIDEMFGESGELNLILMARCNMTCFYNWD